MPTTFRRALVSLTAAMAITLGIAACARPATYGTSDLASLMEPRPFMLRFDNEAPEHVHVYLIDENRQWLLGRVEPGAIAALRIPEEAIAKGSPFARLAVITGEPVTLQAARHPRAMLTLKQTPSEILSQRWWFAQGELMSLRRDPAKPIPPRTSSRFQS